MMFSDINQAFNTHDDISGVNNNMDIRELKKQVIHNPNYKETFYNAQGDIEQNNFDYTGPMQGTNITDIKYEQNNKVPLANNTLQNYKNKPISRKKHSCGYFMNKFIETIIQNDNMSITSSEDIINSSKFDNIYDHVRRCSYCRSHINTKLKKIYNKPTKEITNNTDRQTSNIAYSFAELSRQIKDVDIKDFNIKEVIIIIFIGIVIIFILDMFVKIGKRIG
jgi:predicted HNH restriction endonuclease